jgi:putative NIF3 family GTP cyclohydrolase 1 type 2
MVAELARLEDFAVVDSLPYVFPIKTTPYPTPACQVLVEATVDPVGAGATLDFAVAWSTDRVNWATVSGETALTQLTTSTLAVVDGLTVSGLFLRLIPTIGGGSPTGGLVETQAGVTAVAAQGTLSLPDIPTGAVKSQGTLTMDTQPTGEVAAEGTLTLPTIPVGAVKSQGTLTLDTQPTGEVASQGTLTVTSQPDDGDTFTLNGKVYTFQDTLTDVDGNIFTGGTEAQAKANIEAAINLTGTAGVDYAASMTLHPTISCGTFAGDDVVLTAKTPGSAGDALTTTETFNDPTSVFDAATLGTTTAGTDSDTYTIGAKTYTLQNTLVDADGNVQIGGSLAATKANIVAAMDLSGTPGTDYATSMTAHTTTDMAAFIVNDAVLSAKVAGVAGDTIATTETFAAGTNVVDAATLGTTTAGVAGDTMTVDGRTYVYVNSAADLEVGGDDEIHIGANVAATKVNIVAAFDDSGTAGTDYSDSITPHATVSIAAFAADDAVLTAVTAGTAGNAIATTETFTPVGNVFDAATLGTTTTGTDPDTYTIGGKTYTFQNTLTDVDGNVNIGGSLAQAKLNLVAAMDLSGVAGTDYATSMSAHTTVDVAAFIVNDAVLTAKVPGTAGDSIATTETFAAGTNVFDAATLGTTTAGVAGDTMTVDGRTYLFTAVGELEVGADDQISIGAAVANTQANIVAAFDLSGVAGTDYSTGMTAHATVTIAAFAADDAVLTAVTTGVGGNSIVTTETFTPAGDIFDAATLGTTTAGVDAVGEISTINVGTSSSGTWTMTVDAQTTAALAWNITAAALKTAVELLSTVSTLVSVTGTGSVADPWILTHAAADGAQVVSIDDSNLADADFGSISVTVLA